MKAYIDTSAFAKIFMPEHDSPALKSFLDTHPDDLRLMSSVLLETEARRVARSGGVSQAVVTAALSEVNLARAPRALFTEAGYLDGVRTRSLDALHLATALRHNVDLLIAYDQRFVDAATAHGVPTVSPA